MPTLVTGIWINNRKQEGFTLLEIMVVLILIGIITGFAVLSVGRRDMGEFLADEARRLAALVELSQQEALLRGEQRGILFMETGYSFWELTPAGEWRPVSGTELSTQRTLPSDFKLKLEVEGRPIVFSDTDVPQVLLLSSGEVTEFKLVFTAEYVRGYLLASDLTGALELRPLQ